MKTLEDQLIEYGAHHERVQEDIALEDVTHQKVLHSPTKRWNKYWAAAAAAAAILLVVGVIPFLTNQDESAQPEPSASAPVSTIAGEEQPSRTVADETTPSTTVPTQPVGVWVQSSWVGPTPRWVTAYPSGGFVAGDLGREARFSTDGINWTDTPIHPQLDGYTDLYIEGRFALANSIPSDHPEVDATWHPGQTQSSDVAWETLLEFTNGGWKVWDVGAPIMEPPVQYGNLTLVYPQNPDGSSLHDTYLITADGVTFEEHPMPRFERVVSRPEFFTYFGGFGVYQEVNRLYLSTDGLEWDLVDLPDLVPSVSGAPHVVHFHDLDDQLVAQPMRDSLLWTSSDGHQWEAREEPDAPWPDARRVLHKTPNVLVLTMTGWELLGGAIWVSLDGHEWNQLAGPSTALSGTRSPVFSVAGNAIFQLPATGEATGIWVRSLPFGQDG